MKQEDENDITKPLHVPANFDEQAPINEQVIYALAYLGEASVGEVVDKLDELNPKRKDHATETTRILKDLFDKGFINGTDQQGKRRYNLSKVVRPNTGHVK